MYVKMSLHKDDGTKLWQQQFTPAGMVVWHAVPPVVERGLVLKKLVVMPDVSTVPLDDGTEDQTEELEHDED